MKQLNQTTLMVMLALLLIAAGCWPSKAQERLVVTSPNVQLKTLPETLVTLDRVNVRDTAECWRITTALAMSRVIQDAAEFFPDPNATAMVHAVYHDMSPSAVLRRQAEREERREAVGRDVRLIVECTTRPK